jgi:hypothetical protein
MLVGYSSATAVSAAGASGGSGSGGDGCGFVDGGKRAADSIPSVTQVEVVDGGVMESRRHLNVRGKSATLPAITEKDWLDLKFGVEAGVDAFALSFVKVSACTPREEQQSRKTASALQLTADCANGDVCSTLRLS